MLGRDGLDQRVVDEGLDQRVQRLALEQAGAQGGGQAAQAEQFGRVAADIGLGQPVIPGRTQERQGRDQGPGADARDDGEGGP